MNELNLQARQRVSDLVDGWLQGEECAQALEATRSDLQALQAWHLYHVVGDALRSPELATDGRDFAFLDKLERRLALEPTRPVPQGVVSESSVVTDTSRAAPNSVAVAANGSVVRWQMLAGVACMALVGVVGWSLWTQADGSHGGQLASSTRANPDAVAVIATETTMGTMMRDPRLDELMAAHRQLGGNSALQVPAGFLRNATYEGGGR